MTWAEIAFLIFPVYALAMGYIMLKLSERESARFDRERERHSTK